MSEDISRGELQSVTASPEETEAFVFGMLIGLCIGGGLGLICAPMKGSDTRKAIKEHVKIVEETLTDLKPKVEALAAGVEETVAKIKNIMQASKAE